MSVLRIVVLAAVAGLAGCKPDYSANSYNSNAVQQANKVDQGVVVGRRPVGVSSAGTAGAVTGAAAGGIAGSQVGGGVTAAFGALGGTVMGGLVGTAVEKTAGETTAFEYVVRKANGELLSVTQQDAQPLAVGQNVLVIAGNQARIVPDYTVAEAPQPAPQPPPLPTETAPPPAAVSATPLAPLAPLPAFTPSP